MRAWIIEHSPGRVAGASSLHATRGILKKRGSKICRYTYFPEGFLPMGVGITVLSRGAPGAGSLKRTRLAWFPIGALRYPAGKAMGASRPARHTPPKAAVGLRTGEAGCTMGKRP